MASIQRIVSPLTKDVSYRAQVRVKGRSSESATFPNRKEAEAWAVRIASGNFVTGCLTSDVTAPFSPPRILLSRSNDMQSATEGGRRLTCGQRLAGHHW